MSVFTYNGIVLPYAYMTRFQQKSTYDWSKTDLIYTEFDIELQCVINPSYLTQLAPKEDATKLTNPATIMTVVRSKLLQPRKTLSVIFNGTELIPPPIAGNTGTVDAKNGPQPQYCNLMQLTNATYLMSYGITACYWENNQKNADGTTVTPVSNQPGNNTLTNRWTETIDIDDLSMTTRTREGRVIIRSDNPGGVFADQVRAIMCVTGVPPGFLRKSSKYSVTPDGLNINYIVVDVENYKSPPFPAFKAEGEYIEHASKFGVMRTAEAWVKLYGSKRTPQRTLTGLAVAIVARKLWLRANQPAGKKFYLPQQAQLRIGMYENWVEFRARSLVSLNTDKKKRIFGLDGMATTNTITPNSNVFQPNVPAYPKFGTAGLLLHAAAYFDPSLRQTALDPKSDQLTVGAEPGTAGLHAE